MSRFVLRHLALAIFAGVAFGCASSGSSASDGARPADASPRRDRTQITAADMKDLPVSNLLEAVQHLHPEWLTLRNSPGISQSRNPTADQGVQVYIDLQHAGTVNILSQLSITSAASLKYYSPSEAQARFGNGNLNGAIQVISVAKR